MLKKLLCAATAAVIALSLTSCTDFSPTLVKNDQHEICFSWWGNEKRNNYMLRSVKTFEEKNRDISVIEKYSEFEGYKVKAKADLDSGRQADVMMVNYDWLYEYENKNESFYDLEELSDIKLDNFTAEELKYGRIDGKLRGIPASLQTLTFFYNSTIYDQYDLSLPKTWDDLFNAAAIMSPDGMYPTSFNQKGFWLVCNAYNEQISGNTLFDDKGNFTATEEDIQNMLNFYLKLVKKKVSKRAEDFNSEDISRCKTAGVAAWISNADHYCSEAIESGLNIEVGAYPTTGNYTLYGWYIKPMSLYTVSRTSEEPEAAAKLLNYMLNDAAAISNQGIEQGIPLSRSAVETLEANNMFNGIEYAANVKMKDDKELKQMNCFLENQKVMDIFSAGCDKVYFSGEVTDKCVKEVYEEMKSVLSK